MYKVSNILIAFENMKTIVGRRKNKCLRKQERTKSTYVKKNVDNF
jgi:hypothetical protein